VLEDIVNKSAHFVPPGHYLILSQGREDPCTVEMLHVRRIIGLLDLVQRYPTPMDPEGGIELHGKVLPLIDLRRDGAPGNEPYNEEACILVVEIQVAGRLRLIGLVVETICV
jgi:chemotaxis signal transduction protein